ncbi:HET-domain-containing protein [Apiospora sp. TS-2023a]
MQCKVDPKTVQLWLAIHELCSNDWFTRAWTFPELVLSVDPRIQCGRMLARWPDVAELVEGFWEGPARPVSPWRPGVFLKLNEAVTQGKGEDAMSNLIRARAGSDVTDPRDFFYCLLGVAKDLREWENTIRADYNVSTPSLYAAGPPTLFRSPIRYFLPSWVPDWGITADHGVDPKKTLPQYWEHQDNGPVDDLDGVLILPFWQGGPKRITILSGLIPAASLRESDIEPIARAAATVLQVPFDLQRKTESKVYRLLDASLAHLQSYNNWYPSEATDKHPRETTNDYQQFLPFKSTLEIDTKEESNTAVGPAIQDWEKQLRFDKDLGDVDNVMQDESRCFRLAVLNNGEVVAVPASSIHYDEVFTAFVSPSKRPGFKQWVACVGRPISGHEAANEGIARYAKEQFLGPLRNALDLGKADGQSVPGSDWASLGPFADKAPTLKQVQADLNLEDDLFDIRHYSLVGVAVDASASCNLHARASIHYAAIF